MLVDSECNENLFETQSVSLTSSSDNSATLSAEQSIVTSAATSTSGFWEPESNTNTQWLQATFQHDVRVNKFVFMGSGLSTSTNRIEAIRLYKMASGAWEAVTNPNTNAEVNLL